MTVLIVYSGFDKMLPNEGYCMFASGLFVQCVAFDGR